MGSRAKQVANAATQQASAAKTDEKSFEQKQMYLPDADGAAQFAEKF